MESFAGRLRVLELYSGIGGMHWALKESGVEYDVVQAMDVNTTANKIYRHNFPDVVICASSITKLTLNQLIKWAPNTILMSPPCQPFTRVGKKQDCQDQRTQSFLHLLDLLRKLDHKPEYILVENVKGFETSQTRKLLVDMLNDCNYTFQEFLLTPLQFGIPNCRMRYYLIAKLRPLELAFRTSSKITSTVPEEADLWLRHRSQPDMSPEIKDSRSHSRLLAEASRNMRHCEEEDDFVCVDGSRLDQYLEKAETEYFNQFLLNDKQLRMFVVMDIVHPSFKKSSCFTKRYGHYVEGAGSLVMMMDDVKVVREASDFKSWAVEHKNRQQWGEAELSILTRLKLRYFTPREVANLLCFPPQFGFPEEVNTIQCHRVLGNSLNVHVVSILIRLMLLEPGVVC